MNIREYFTDFRYLSSSDEPHIMREFVRYEEVKELIDKIINKQI